MGEYRRCVGIIARDGLCLTVLLITLCPKAHKRADLQKMQQEAQLLEAALQKAKLNAVAGKEEKQSSAGEDCPLETIIENITVTLSKIAEKRRSQVSK